VKLYVNGNIISEEQAVVSIYDHGFLYGIGLFETFRTYGGKPFLLDRHLERMARGLGELSIQHQLDPVEISSIISDLLQANGLEEAYIRYTVTAGTDVLGLPSTSYDKPTVIVYMKPLPPKNPHLDLAGKALQLLELRRNTPEGSIRHKSLHYMNSILAKRELARYLQSAGAEGLMLDAQGHLAEGIVSNVFFVKNDRLCTPAISTGILPGITRDYVLEVTKALGIYAEEGLYHWEDLLAADEVFITNSIQELVPITSLYDTEGRMNQVSQGEAGPVTSRLLHTYRLAAERGDNQ
jgi:4-amino-4-deoxychorismate lyase